MGTRAVWRRTSGADFWDVQKEGGSARGGSISKTLTPASRVPFKGKTPPARAEVISEVRRRRRRRSLFRTATHALCLKKWREGTKTKEPY